MPPPPETPKADNVSLLHQDDSSDGNGIAKPRLEADDQEVRKRDPAGTVQDQPPRRYWVRPLVAVVIPTIVTAYFGVIWAYLVQGIANDEAVKYRTFSGSLIFYSWFVIGVFALSWSEYGLVGVEASMLHSRFWRTQNLVTLLMHSDGTWSSPSGWIKAIMRREFHRLWTLLAFLSVLPFIGIPLSGLVFEISDGYIKTSDAPLVRGRNETTFNARYERGDPPAQQAWRLGSVPTMPGLGIIYTGESVDRSEHSDLQKLPNTLPLSDSIPDLFLTPQPDMPVSGKAWGLRVKYDCSIVRSASQFTVLTQKHASSIISTYCRSDVDDRCITLQTPSGYTITLANSTSPYIFHNVEAFFEIGTSGPPEGKYNGNHPDFEADEGDNSLVFEYAAWQYRAHGSYDDRPFTFNTTVGPSIEGIGSLFVKSDDTTYAVNSTFFALKGDVIEGAEYKNRTTNAGELMALDEVINGTNALIEPAAPIGVRCVASSGVGTAELDGLTSTFRNFQRSGPLFDKTYGYGSMRFGYTAERMLAGQFLQHYVSGGLPVGRPVSNSERYPQFIDAPSLLRSVNLAFANDAFDLMYGFTSGFKREWLAPDLTSSRKGKILSATSLIPNAGVGYFVLALLCLWAAISAALALCYGFRKRPADTLDGDAMLRKGADMAHELRGNDEFMSGKPLHESGTHGS